jgi:hypothetical protein
VTDTFAETQRQTRSRNESTVSVLATDREDVTVECECGHDCGQQLTVGTRMYRKVRREQTWHLVAVGHEVAARQRVVLRQSEFVIVEGRRAPSPETRRRAPDVDRTHAARKSDARS